MDEYKLVKRKPTAKELITLRDLVGWTALEKNAIRKGIKNSLFAVCAVNKDGIIGTARVVGDGSTCFYIQDVIVQPLYQGMGIGTEIIKELLKYIDKKACVGATVGLMAAKGKEEFYEKFGFWRRPNEDSGHGMMMVWKEGYFLFEL